MGNKKTFTLCCKIGAAKVTEKFVKVARSTAEHEITKIFYEKYPHLRHLRPAFYLDGKENEVVTIKDLEQ